MARWRAFLFSIFSSQSKVILLAIVAVGMTLLQEDALLFWGVHVVHATIELMPLTGAPLSSSQFCKSKEKQPA